VLLRRLGFVMPLLLPLVLLLGWRLGGAWNFLTVGYAFVFAPFADHVAGVDTGPSAPPRGTARGWDLFFDALLYAWLPIQLALLAFAVRVVGTVGLTAQIGLTVSVGLVTGGVGIVVAHELGHRQGRLARWVAGMLLLSVGYLHFYIEHNQGHHARVATDADPATARAGESFWHFLPRTVVQGFASAWHIETRRLAAAGRAVFGWRNRMLWALAVPLAVTVLLGLWYGAAAATLFVAQSAVAVNLLETVNYIEHYGLVRRRGADGRHEQVGVQHSWNSSQRFSNWLTFNLQRHSHHHVQVTRRYQELEHAPAAPQLPSGYSAMLIVAMLPPLWRRLMDPRLRAWQREHGPPG
jgi:alkane 1-monooxygenase